ncbi:MAG: Dam family site-specific DNA-(adenine-N6)-methyltransferase [Gammaproteobacteria bacterium]|nr:Dam family site-specific DNA-(adenine-N6)-methyltransferase [Gammaproteobacteria bacterium]MCH9763195.1 Dam family site-specific DNA-(adenine-N6)-methyltransferase [Gammaproteobacteria bacterium]
MERTRPFLKWAGGKYRCLDHVIKALPKGSRLIEPFTGSGAVFLNAPHAHFLLTDANADLIALYKHLKQEGRLFIRYCQRFFCEASNQSDIYYQYRVQFNQSKLGSRKRAALFLYLNRHGYNGLCRYNLSGGYNVPFGRYNKPYFPQKELEIFYQKSQSAEFITADFKQTFSHTQPGDVIYCDPPYAPLSKTSDFTAYTRGKFGEADQINLAQLAKDTAQKGTSVIISNHDTPFTRDLYHGANITSFPVRRNISCKSSRRLFVRELIATFK